MSKQILKIIKKLQKLNNGHSGECGNFAVALNRLCKNKGSYVALLDSINDNSYNHVVLKIGSKLYDSSGVVSVKQIMNRYGYDEEYDDVIFWLEPIEEESALRGTECGCPSEVEGLLNEYYILIHLLSYAKRSI